MQTHVVARTLVFNQGGKLLLLRRCANEVYRPGGIDLPGGKVEANEELLDGALRETLEETGLAIDPGSVQLVYAFARANRNIEARGNINAVGLFFACHTVDTDVRLNPEEHDAYYWCTLDEAIAKTDHANHKELLEYVQQHHIAAELWSAA
jgi:8-oxo-dGTP diphosphatase